MNPTHRSLLAALLLVAAGGASAEIFRCTDRGGSVTYQQDPCASASEGGVVNIPTTYPDYGFERERLAQREAALDARLLKRLEIEAAERIARDDRIARQKEAEAARDLAQADLPVYVVGRPLYASRHPRRLHPASMR